jgi:hypothetical protein
LEETLTLLQFLDLPHWAERASILEELEVHIIERGVDLRLPETFLQGEFPALSCLEY